MTHAEKHRGMILVSSLLFMALLMAIAMALYASVNQKQRQLRFNYDGNQAELYAESGVHYLQTLINDVRIESLQRHIEYDAPRGTIDLHIEPLDHRLNLHPRFLERHGLSHRLKTLFYAFGESQRSSDCLAEQLTRTPIAANSTSMPHASEVVIPDWRKLFVDCDTQAEQQWIHWVRYDRTLVGVNFDTAPIELLRAIESLRLPYNTLSASTSTTWSVVAIGQVGAERRAYHARIAGYWPRTRTQLVATTQFPSAQILSALQANDQIN